MEYWGDWRDKHYEIICNFIEYLNNQSDSYVLKDGTSLMMCYGLTRFSEDIDLDGFSKNIEYIVNEFCKIHGFDYRTAKNTDTVKRYMIHYGGNKPLKVEVSYRVKTLDFKTETDVINNILVYTIENIMVMKLTAYSGRDKIRDLFDVVFIGLEYGGYLNNFIVQMARNTLSHKGIEQYDYVVKDQYDELIDNDKLAEDFLELWDILGLN